MVSIGFGALFIAYFGSADDDSGRELAELLRLLKRDHFVAWLIVSGVVVVILFTYLSLVKFHRKRKDAHKVDWLPCVDFGLAEFKILKGCAYGVISGTLSAHSLLFAKISVEIIINSTINHDHSLQNIRSWFIIFTFLSLAIIQLFFLNKGLKNISTSILYPVVFCTYNIINITNGLIFYNKLETLTIAQIFMIVLGTALVLAGVFALSWRLKDENEPDSQFTRDSDQKVQRSSSSVNSETRSLLKSDDEEVGYVSFASPSKVGEVSPVSPFGGDMFDDNLRKTSFGSHYSNNNITPFKYGSILDDGRNNNLIVTRTRRVLSFEQNELLQQLKADPDL
jgi:multidrug transporter EmrE-like cation transporter